MRRLSIILLLVAMSVTVAMAQCVIDNNNQTVGISPPANTLDCVVNDGSTLFDETLQLLFPTSYSGVDLDSIILTSLTNLPSGITYTCNPPSCKWNGGDRGCILLNGTTTATPGSYGLGVEATAYVSTGGFSLPPQTLDSAAAAGAGFSYELTVITSVQSCPNTIQPLTLNILTPVDTVCAGEEGVLNAVAGGGDGQYTYLWDDQFSSTTSLIQPTPLATKTYSVTVTDGLGSTITASATIVVNPVPVADFTAVVDTTNGMVTFTSTSTAATDLSWDFGDGQFGVGSPVTNTYAVFNADTAYDVQLLAIDNVNGCGPDSITKTIDFTAANDTVPDTTTTIIDIYDAPVQAKIFPNPNNGEFDVWVNLGSVNENISMQLISIEGRQVYTETIRSNGGELKLPVSVNNLNKGIYFLYIRSQEVTAVSKILIK